MLTTADAVAAYVGGGRTAADVQTAWQASEGYVADRCTWPVVDDDGNEVDPPAVLVRAVFLLSARFLARKASPDGFLGMGEFGPARVPISDRDVDRLIFPWRKVVLA